MAKDTKKRTMIYSNVKANKKRAEELSKENDVFINLNDDHINLNDEVVIGLSKDEQKIKNSNAKKVRAKSKKKNKKIAVKNKSNTKKPNAKKQNSSRPEVKKQDFYPSPLFKFLLLAIVIVIGLFVISRTSFFNITQVQISIQNQNVLTEELIKNLSEITEGTNSYSIKKGDAIESIKSNPYVENVKIRRVFPNKIKIEVEERTVRFELQLEDKYIYIDNQGYILEVGEKREDLVTLSGYSSGDLTYGNRLNEEDLDRLSDVMQIMKEAENNGIEKEITRIDIKDRDNYNLYIDGQHKVIHLGNINSINDKLTYAKKIMEVESDYEGEIFVNVDLNNGEYPYFREQV